MVTYVAESVVMGVLVDHLYEADSEVMAREIADSEGWRFLGIPVEVDIFDDMPSWGIH